MDKALRFLAFVVLALSKALRLLLFAAISEFPPLILRRFWIPGFIWGAFKTRGLIERSSPVNSLHGFLRLILTQNELLILVPLLLIVFEPEEIRTEECMSLEKTKQVDHSELTRRSKCSWLLSLPPWILLRSHHLILSHLNCNCQLSSFPWTLPFPVIFEILQIAFCCC